MCLQQKKKKQIVIIIENSSYEFTFNIKFWLLLVINILKGIKWCFVVLIMSYQIATLFPSM